MNHTIAEYLSSSPLLRLESRLLLQHVTGYSHAQLITHDDELLDEVDYAWLHELTKRRIQGEPMAYLLGHREFYGRMFRVSPAVLIPRPETELLLEAALSYVPPDGSLWDLGTGSGAVAISAKLERADIRVFASDVCGDALTIAQDNAQTLGAQVTWAQGSWFEAANSSLWHDFDVLVSNPPYIEQNDPHLIQGDLRFEPSHALTDFADGLKHIRTLAHNGAAFLHSGGVLLLEHGFNQGSAVRNILKNTGWKQVQTLRDLAGLERVSLGFKP